MTSKKKMVLAGMLVLVMAVSAVGGTVAWLNDSDELTNTFLVGAFTPPTKPDPDPDKPDPDDPNPPTNQSVKGYIHEPYWDANDKDNTATEWVGKQDKHRLVPGRTTVKDPYVGIGPDSEAGYVYVYIENKMPTDTVYFQLNQNWAPVTDHVTKVSTTVEATGDWYTGGLFKYVTDDKTALLALDPSKTVTSGETKTNPTGDVSNAGDIWTKTPVFTTVKTNAAEGTLASLQGSDDKTMTVHAFIYQKIDTSKGDGDAQDSGKATVASGITVVEDAAIDWANEIKAPTTGGGTGGTT